MNPYDRLGDLLYRFLVRPLFALVMVVFALEFAFSFLIGFLWIAAASVLAWMIAQGIEWTRAKLRPGSYPPPPFSDPPRPAPRSLPTDRPTLPRHPA